MAKTNLRYYMVISMKIWKEFNLNRLTLVPALQMMDQISLLSSYGAYLGAKPFGL